MQQRAEETRARILEASAQCFARYGYDATGVAEICHSAGLSKGAFYHHFPTKQAVFLELLDGWLAVLDAQLQAQRAAAANVPQAFGSIAGMFQQVFQAAGELLPIFLEFWTKAARDPAVREETLSHYRRYHEFFSDMIQAGVDEGTLRPVDPETATQLLMSLAVGLILQQLLDPQGADWGQVAQEGMLKFVAIIRQEASQ